MSSIRPSQGTLHANNTIFIKLINGENESNNPLTCFFIYKFNKCVLGKAFVYVSYSFLIKKTYCYFLCFSLLSIDFRIMLF